METWQRTYISVSVRSCYNLSGHIGREMNAHKTFKRSKKRLLNFYVNSVLSRVQGTLIFLKNKNRDDAHCVKVSVLGVFLVRIFAHLN